MGVTILLLVAIVLVITFNNDRSSQLTDNLPSNILERKKAFQTRVETVFPTNISAQELKSLLHEYGFSIKNNHAKFVNQRFIYFCPTTYYVSWVQMENGTIERIEGSFIYTC